MSISWPGKCLRAFTLTELIVGMIVSGIVISALWYAFHIVSHQWRQNESATTRVTEISLFHRQLFCDYNHADTLYMDDETVTCGSKTEIVEYRINVDDVIRTAGTHIDTFHVKLADVKVIDQGRLTGTILAGDETETILFSRNLSAKDKLDD